MEGFGSGTVNSKVVNLSTLCVCKLGVVKTWFLITITQVKHSRITELPVSLTKLESNQHSGLENTSVYHGEGELTSRLLLTRGPVFVLVQFHRRSSTRNVFLLGYMYGIMIVEFIFFPLKNKYIV